MDIDKDSLRENYSSFTDDALLELHSENALVDDAKEILNQELLNQGMSLNPAEQPNYTSVKEIDRSVFKQRGSRILWRIFWRAVFPIIALFILIYISKTYDWVTGG